MKSMNWLLRICNIFLLVILLNTVLYSQEEKVTSGKFGLHSAGVSLGWYNPSMDYWKTKSEFKDAGFSGALEVNSFADFRIISNLHGKIGLGYWQESVNDSLQNFGSTTLLLTGVPVSIDFCYKIEPLEISLFTPYIGAGGEFLFVQHKMKFDLNDDPPAKTGSTVMGHLIAGIETKLSDQFAIDIDLKYKFGNYKQDFKIENPENPDESEIVTETISLNGPRIGLTLRYIF